MHLLEKMVINKKLMAALSFALAAFIALSVVRCMQIHPVNPTEQDNGDDTAIQESLGDTDNAQTENKEAGGEQSDDKDKKIIEAYGPAELEVIDLLAGNLWISADETCFVTFTKSTFEETPNGSVRPFVIESLKVENIEGHEALITRTTMSVRTDEGIALFTLDKATAQGGNDNNSEATGFLLSSNAFENSREFYLRTIPDGFEVSK
jgi:hypothetical protein